MNARTGYRVIESNECAGTMRYYGLPFATSEAAELAARDRFGNPSRKRRFACMLLEAPDGTRTEIIRGAA